MHCMLVQGQGEWGTRDMAASQVLEVETTFIYSAVSEGAVPRAVASPRRIRSIQMATATGCRPTATARADDTQLVVTASQGFHLLTTGTI